MSDAEFLGAFLETQRKQCKQLEQLCSSDLSPVDRLPTTSDDEERCARIADSHGFDGSLFRNLLAVEEYDVLLHRLRKRIRTIPRIIATIEKQEKEPAPEPTQITLKQIDLDILNYLATQSVSRAHVDIEVGSGVSKKTVGQRLKILRNAGLTERPNGEKGGESITPLGRTKATPNLPHNDAQG